jgi:hypothetical protein
LVYKNGGEQMLSTIFYIIGSTIKLTYFVKKGIMFLGLVAQKIKRWLYIMMIAVISILSVVLALAATVLAFIFIVPEKKREKLNKFGKFLHDTVNFKYLIIEKILQAMYIFATTAVVLFGFFMLFYVQSGYEGYYYSTPSTWYGGYGILLMILGPIAVRLTYEFLMLALLLVKNVIQINNKLKNENNETSVDVFNIPEITKTEEPAPCFCANCGTENKGNDFCTNCGTKL